MSISTLKFTGSSMKSLQSGIDVVSHNISNLNTLGYKKKSVAFENLVGHSESQKTFSGSTVASITPNFTQGTIKTTGSYSDLALQGDGFFAIQAAGSQTTFSRAGHFVVDVDGKLVDPHGGYLLSIGGSAISMPQNLQAVEINAAGEVMIKTNDSDTFEFHDQIQLATFTNPTGLDYIGNNLYKETANSGQPEFSAAGQEGSATVSTLIVAGALENSNVDLSTSLVDLISLQRSYQAVSRAANTTSDLLELTIGLSS